MSPGSTILVYESVFPGNQPFDDMFQQIADDDAADVVSTSWGLAESESNISSMGAEHAAFQQMTAEGMTFFAAAGDDGAADRAPGSDNADFPSSDPYTVSAGGTTLFLNSDNTIASETAWSGAGGADSILFAQPDYETGVTGLTPNTSCDSDHTSDFPDDVADGIPGAACAAAGDASRQNSDFSLDADPATSYSFFYNGRWSQAGGTSFVAPQLAGMYAIVTARLRKAVQSTTRRVGQGQPSLYFDATANPTDFNDITDGNNGFPAGAGWDHPTGLGTPHDVDTMINNLVTILSAP
jgi:kumamolisin